MGLSRPEEAAFLPVRQAEQRAEARIERRANTCVVLRCTRTTLQPAPVPSSRSARPEQCFRVCPTGMSR